MTCKVCGRKAVEHGFCQLHAKAYMNVVKKSGAWKAASDVTWTQYLVEIQKNSLTGVWAKDVAKQLIEEETPK
jgi:hypothetical protein